VITMSSTLSNGIAVLFVISCKN